MASNENLYMTRVPGADGIVVVDPNGIEDGGCIKPRYVKQEDLMIYVELKALLNPKSNVIEKDQDTVKSVIITKGVYYNSVQTKNQTSNEQNYFTTNWTEMFDANRPEDVQGFGIQNLDIEFNASLVPKIHIEFIDVRGKNLLERGNDPNNPYNVFYTFPYPLFELTVKGYFGKAITMPLVMEKAITRFDPSTGSYIISADFGSWTFAMLNDLIVWYALIVPYMYPTKGATDGEDTFLGFQIVKEKYEQLNKMIEQKYGRVPENNQIKLSGLFHLKELVAKIIKDPLMAEAAQRQPAVGSFLNILEAFRRGLQEVADNPSEDPAVNEKLVNDLVLINNDMLKTQKTTIVNNNSNGLGTEAFDIVLKTSDYYKDQKVVQMDDAVYEKYRNDILTFEDRAEVKDSENFKKQIIQKIHFIPSVENVVFAIVVHMDAFVELLKRKSQDILDAITKESATNSSKYDNFEYIQLGTGVYYRMPWPEYYSPYVEGGRYKDFPGNSSISDIKKWGEVEFINEMYNAIDRLNKDLSSGLFEDVVGGETYVATPLLFSPFSLATVSKMVGTGNNSESEIVNHMLEQVLTVIFHSGLLYRPIPLANKSVTGNPKAAGVYSIMVNNMFKILSEELKTNTKGTIIAGAMESIMSTIKDANSLPTYGKDASGEFPPQYIKLRSGNFVSTPLENNATTMGKHYYRIITDAASGDGFNRFKEIYLKSDAPNISDYKMGPSQLPYNPKALEVLDLFAYNTETEIDGISTAAATFTNNYIKDDMFITRQY